MPYRGGGASSASHGLQAIIPYKRLLPEKGLPSPVGIVPKMAAAWAKFQCSVAGQIWGGYLWLPSWDSLWKSFRPS